MRRRLIAVVWIAGGTVPVLLATVYLVGCCVLPFHGVLHKLMPLCDFAMSAVRGEHEHDATPAAPARAKQEPVKRITSVMPSTFVVTASDVPRVFTPAASTAYRSFISLGATRCDRDVGWHVLVATFLI